MPPIHNFCWVSMNGENFKDTGKVISASMENVNRFEKSGFDVKIPYYLSNKLDPKTADQMKRSLKKDDRTIDFNDILKQDSKNPKLQTLAEKTKTFIEKVEKGKSSDGDKICAIVDVMKLYMVSKQNNMALDFNIELNNKKDYSEKLKSSPMLFSSQTSEYNNQPPENKLLYINDKNPAKVSFSDDIITQANRRITADGGRVDRNSVYHIFTKETDKHSFEQTGSEVSYPFTTQSYYNQSNAHSR